MAKAKLGEYRKKRDPKKTPEPFGGRKRGKRPIFVVQRHDARRLHYDFRLERDGALASWAVPEDVPKGDDWAFEIKWDGYRIVASLSGGDAELRTRKDQDYTQRFANVARALPKAIRTPDCVVDGEVCALDEDGRPSFSAMQQAGSGTPIVYYVFDLLEVDGEPVVDLPLTERRERLEQLLDRRNNDVRLSEAFDDGEAILAAARQQRLEGVMAKRVDSRYLPGRRTRDWLKIKARNRQEFVIVGYTRGKGRREGTLGSLVLGAYQGGELVYAGNCGTGFTEKEIDRLLEKLRPLVRDTPPLRVVPKMPRVRKGDVVWVEPDLVADVEFVEWTHDGHLRAPAYKGLREDKDPKEVRREEPLAREITKGGRTLRLSNLDKVFWPDEGITKGDLLTYYRAVADVLVPHLRDRPFTLKRYPDGWQGEFFFQKDAPKHMPDWIPTVEVEVTTRETPRRRRKIRAPLVNDELGLLWMVNMGCIDMNTWYSRVDKPERPDWVLFDLDPSPDVGFPETVEVALLVKEALDALGLESYPKTSGSEGMHVLVPIARRHTYDDTREFAEIIAGALARRHRGLVTTEWSKATRRGRPGAR